MNPAYSVIFFTVSSGAGYGLLFVLSLGHAIGALPAERWSGLVGLVLAGVLATAGLLASTLHLGHPERAWRGLTQWRSSWLSREGVAALAAYLPAAVLGVGWVILEASAPLWSAAGVLAALLAAATVYCTGMIYACLRTIPRWHTGWTVPVYLLWALASGLVLAALLAHVFALGVLWPAPLAALATLLALAAKLAYWRHIDTAPATATAESATGLGALGRVRQLEPPHTGENFVQREMGYRVARKHAAKLRRTALAGTGAAAALSLVAVLPGTAGLAAAALATAALAGALLVERWLFFAEARHVVTLYYGADAV
ncbi:MAG: dimethyl sulfoxide reductase anchor subunit family protein [Alphaproteobacteria bacterium]